LRQGLAARGGNSPPHLIALGYIALQRNDLESAGDYLTRAAEEAPNQPEVQLYLGSVHYRSGRHTAAVKAFSRVLEAEPGHREARANLVLALGKSGRIAQALEVFRQAGPSGRDDPTLLNAAAYACLINGMAAEGIRLVERSLELAPGHPETRNLAAALRREAAGKGPGGGE
jgi:Flp pilus assembly protein TadD